MLGAIIGDIVGSIYEFDNIKTKDFELFDRECFFTDDTVMSVAVAEALLDTQPTDKEDEIEDKLAATMKKWGESSAVTHNHPEGIKGAEATAAAIFLARNGASKQEIREYVEKEFSYNLDFTCDEIRTTYYFNETCMDTVPQAIVAFLDGESFEDVIRTGVSIGGDTDTLCAISGSVAEAYYGIPEDIGETAKSFLTDDLLEVVEKFYNKLQKSQY